MSVYEHASGEHRKTIRSLVIAVLAAWFALALYLVLAGHLASPPGAPPILVVMAAGIPPVLFLILCRVSASLRNFVLDIDLRFLVAVQGWRVLGGVFLVLMIFGILPGQFALPAGLGDVAIGVTAPWILLALVRRPQFATSGTFLAWNLLGILDLVAALAAGGLASGAVPGFAGQVTTAPMAVWPLAMIPGFLVPLFIILHSIAIMQSRRLARA